MTIRIMLKHFGWWSSLGGLVIAAQTAVAAPVQLQCPSQYPNEKQLSILRAAGWQPVSYDVQHGLLMEAGVLLGAPSDNGVLRGADLPNMAGREFHFFGSDRDQEKWVYCDYGIAPGGRLAYSLAVQITRCKSKEITVRRRLTQAHFRCD